MLVLSIQHFCRLRLNQLFFLFVSEPWSQSSIHFCAFYVIALKKAVWNLTDKALKQFILFNELDVNSVK